MNELGGRTTKETHVSSYTTSVDPRTLPDFNTRGVYKMSNNNVHEQNGSSHACSNSTIMNNRLEIENKEINRNLKSNGKWTNQNVINDREYVEQNTVDVKKMKKRLSAITSSSSLSSSSLYSLQLHNHNKDKNSFTEENDDEIRNEHGHRLRKKYTTTTVTTITTTTILLPKMQEAVVLQPISVLETLNSVNTTHSTSPDIVLQNEVSDNNHVNVATITKREVESVESSVNKLPSYNSYASINREFMKRYNGECNTNEQSTHAVVDDAIRKNTTTSIHENNNIAVLNEQNAKNTQGMWQVEQNNSTMIRKSSQMDYPPTLEELGIRSKVKSESSQNTASKQEEEEEQQEQHAESDIENRNMNENERISSTHMLQSNQPWIVDEQREEVEGEMLSDPKYVNIEEHE